MKTGVALAVIAIGAIFAFAVTTNTSVFNLHTAGWVLMIIGVIGSYLGGFLGRLFGLYSNYQSTGGWISSLIGAIIVTFLAESVYAWQTFR